MWSSSTVALLLVSDVEKLLEVTPMVFKDIEKLGVSLSRIRIMRIDTLEEMK